MPDSDTKPSTLPARLGQPETRPSLARSETRAAFLSQLLAGRAGLAPQRNRRRGSAEGAIGAYSDGSKVAIKRMPMGYRTSIVA